jgi:hypothetical protein
MEMTDLFKKKIAILSFGSNLMGPYLSSRIVKIHMAKTLDKLFNAEYE